jgi:hypothetical protein
MSRRGQWVSRTSLSKQAGALRLSLFVALGLSPLSCGGSAVTDPGGAGLNAQGGGSPGLGGSGAAGADLATICADAKLSPATNLARCSNGLVHRPASIACESRAGQGGTAGALGVAGGGGLAGTGTGGAGEEAEPILCTNNSDCTALRLGWCQDNIPFPDSCLPGCLVDSDCGPSQVCQCDQETPAGRCVYALCKVDSDCGPNSLCAQVKGPCGGQRFQCSQGADECKTVRDCDGAESCRPSSAGSMMCVPGGCGRPFLISDAPRVAKIASRGDWLDAALTPDLSALSHTQRAELAAHWARLGQMEHASIAAFARFNLQLLSLGAPAVLLEACNRALADETAHTRICYALASHYAGTHLGPDRLSIQHCFDDNSLEAVMKLVLTEGCIGETVAALEALEGADSATDPVVRDVLQRIARDEQAHAELAFQFMRWALAQCSPAAREELVSEAEVRLACYEQSAQGTQSSAVRHVVRPLFAAIFGECASTECAAEAAPRRPTPA